MFGEVGGTTELRPAGSDLLPKSPGAAIGFALQDRRRVHGPKTGALDHRSQGDDDKVLRVHIDLLPAAATLAENALHTEVLIVVRESKVRDAGVQGKLHAPLFQPLLKRPYHRVELVVDGSHNPGER